jgi:hypothetical protein
LYTKAKIPQSNCPKKIKPTKTQYWNKNKCISVVCHIVTVEKIVGTH